MLIVVIFGTLAIPGAARAVTTVFFARSQTTNLVAAGITSDTVSSEGYLFTFTRDKLFTGGVGLTNPIGRTLRVLWPDGLEAQAVTSGPAPGGAKITVTRQDGQVFALESFTAKLLANTAGAGASFEIMPLINGQDGAPDPFMYDATGYAGGAFTYNTPELAGFDTYSVTLYVDFALTSLTLVDASLPPPMLDIVPKVGGALQLSWPATATGYVLEATPSLPATVWQPVTNSITQSGGLFTVEYQADSGQRFFRLRK